MMMTPRLRLSRATEGPDNDFDWLVVLFIHRLSEHHISFHAPSKESRSQIIYYLGISDVDAVAPPQCVTLKYCG